MHGQRDRDGCSATMSKDGPEVFSEGCSELGLYLKSVGSRVVESSPCMVIDDRCRVGMVATVVVVVLSCLCCMHPFLMHA